MTIGKITRDELDNHRTFQFEALGASEMTLRLGFPSATTSRRIKALGHLSRHKRTGT